MTDSERAARPYDNSRRREQADATRERIVEAGSALLHTSSIRDWRALTIKSVADQAGVSERTVYRHFGTERGLRDAVMHRLEREAGVDLADLRLDDIADVTASVLRYVSAYPADTAPTVDPTLDDADARRKAALERAVADATGEWSDGDRRLVSAVLDLLWSLSSYESLVTRWDLGPDEAVRGITWIIDLATRAVEEGRRPR